MEVKGHNGAITTRIHNIRLPVRQWSEFAISPVQLENFYEELNLNLNTKDTNFENQLKSVFDAIDRFKVGKSEISNTWGKEDPRKLKDPLKFAIAFGISHIQYVNQHGIKKFVLFDTYKNQKTGEMHKLFSSKVVVVNAKTNGTWLHRGLQMLEELKSKNIDVAFQSISEKTLFAFKVIFKHRK